MDSEKREFVCVWNIENLLFRSEARDSDEYVISPNFEAECLDKTLWRMSFYPLGFFHDEVSCELQCLNRTGEKSALMELDAVPNDKSVEKDVIGYRFELLDKNGVQLSISCIKNYYFHIFNTEDVSGVGDFRRVILNCPENILIIRCVIMRMKEASFHENFNTRRENQRADDAKMDCECKTIYGIDRFTFLFKDLTRLEGKFIIPTSTTLEITLRNISSEKVTIQMGFNDPDTPTKIVISLKISFTRQDGTVVQTLEKKRILTDSNKNQCWEPFTITKNFLHGEYYLKCDLICSNFTRSDEVRYTLPSVSNKREISSQTSGEGEILATALAAQLSRGITISTQTDENKINFDFQKSEKTTGSPLQDDLYTILVREKFTDMTLKAKGVLIPVHKTLLAARSPVFSTMFEQDMLECQTGIIDISDADVETLKLFLKYIYTDTVEINGHENAIKLITIADKYQVAPLKENCSAYLKTILSDENACEVIAVADMLNQEDLKLCATAYIKSNASKILSTPEWKQWLRQNLELAAEIVAEVSSSVACTSNSK